MTSILFVRQPHVYLPEIHAYKAYLAEHYTSVKTFESTGLGHYNPMDFDVVWHFMGTDMKGTGNYVIHEYNSLSTPPFSTLKNLIKRAVNATPDQRIFLTPTVKTSFNFKGITPDSYRDMGIDQAFFNVKKITSPQYDLVYAGGLDRGVIIQNFLNHFSLNMKDATILLVGDAPQKLQERFQDSSNIIFHGRVSYEEVPKLMAKARYGLNIMPDIYPFNIQTATKVLEYAAIGMPIITTDYQWIREFENRYDGKCFKLAPDMSNLSLEALDNYAFKTPNIQNLNWNSVIATSNIFSFLEEEKRSP